MQIIYLRFLNLRVLQYALSFRIRAHPRDPRFNSPLFRSERPGSSDCRATREESRGARLRRVTRNDKVGAPARNSVSPSQE
jgi:hypothetical protein